MKVYFAAQLFNSAEKRFNLTLTNEIEKLGYEGACVELGIAYTQKYLQNNKSC